MSASRIIFLCSAAVLITAGLLWRGAAMHERKGAQKSAGDAVAITAQMPGEKTPVSAFLKRVMESGEAPAPTPEQLTAFVEKQKHSAASLLAAWQLGGDAAWLEEAVRRYPDDPRVALAKLTSMSEMTVESREWIERLKKHDPDNAMGWCYEAMNAFKAGAPEDARAALAEAVRRGRFNAYVNESAREFTNAFRSAGYEVVEAEMMGRSRVMLPQAQLAMNVLRETIGGSGQNLADGTIRDMLALADMVRDRDDGGFLINQLVGLAMERKMLGQLEILDLIPGTKRVVVERLSEVDTERNSVRDLVRRTTPLLSTLDESEWKQYFRRSTVEGELKAMQWLLSRHPEVK